MTKSCSPFAGWFFLRTTASPESTTLWLLQHPPQSDRLAVAENINGHRFADQVVPPDVTEQVVHGAVHGDAVEPDDDVARPEAGVRQRRVYLVALAERSLTRR